MSVESLPSLRDSTTCTSRGSNRSAPSPQPGWFTRVPTRTYNVRPLATATLRFLGRVGSAGSPPGRTTSGHSQPQRSVSSAGLGHQGPHPDVQRPATRNRSAPSPRPGWFTRVPTRTYNVRPLATAALRLLGRVGSPGSPPGRTTSGHSQPQRSVSSAGLVHQGPHPDVQRPATRNRSALSPRPGRFTRVPTRTYNVRPLATATLRLLSRVGSPGSPPGRTTSRHSQPQRSVSSAGLVHQGPHPDVQRPATRNRSALSPQPGWVTRVPTRTYNVRPLATAALRLLGRVGSPGSPPGPTTSGHMRGSGG